MPVTIKITKTLDGDWGTDEDFAEMTDAAIVELVQEDLAELMSEDAVWVVER